MTAPTYTLHHDPDGRPVLQTARLRLRVPQAADLPACIRFWGSDRSHLMGGPWTAEKTQAGFEGILRQWAGNRFGLFILTRPGSDEGIGDTGPYFPETHPEPELGWSLWYQADEGQGLAFEAAVAARAWFFATTPHRTAVSHTDPANHRSHRLLARMGAVVDPDAPHPHGDEPTVTFRHHRGAA